ncbi:CGNR zinc finger domain-containing protein [Streptacidiphilus melanogenes]|uniref:CGNR zinc finger domain-containing protein n=1 Tax=Streptacidiphilus melanogenes TaxID=411235 RepID=UPI0005A9BF8C|nr:CGNR zinc finger domain-containing protein [Streptacidiphilus melanogenes]
MLITHDTECALDALVELLNTSPQACGHEGLSDLAALRGFVVRRELSDVGQLTQADLDAVRRLRQQFWEVLDATSTRDAAELLNAMIARAGTTPRLTDHDGHDWHVHYFAPGAALADRLAAESGIALSMVIVAGERDRLRHCEAPDCVRVFVDLSRNRSRRYCDSRTCGNRLHVAAYRARQRTSPPAEAERGGVGVGS